MFKIEFKRAIKSKRFILVCILIFIISIYGAIDNLPTLNIFINSFNLQYAVDSGELNQFALFTSATDRAIYFVPLISSFAFGCSFLQDRKNGFNRLINTRISNTKYCISKFLVNGTVAGISVTLPNIVFFYLCNVFAGGEIGHTGIAVGGIIDWLMKSNPYVYIIVFLILQFLLAFCYSTIALATSTLIKNEILVLLSPAVFYYITSYLTDYIIKVPLVFKTKLVTDFAMLAEDVNVVFVILQLVVLTLIFGSIYFYFSRKDYVYEN